MLLQQTLQRGGGAEPAGVISSTVDFPLNADWRLAYLSVAGHLHLESKSSGGNHDLRTTHLHLHPRPAAGTAKAVRGAYAKNLGQARHQASRFLDRVDWRRQPRFALPAGVGV